MKSLRDTNRRKLLNLFDRRTLERLSGLDRAWMADRKTLYVAALTRWENNPDVVQDDIAEAIRFVMNKAVLP